MAAARASTRLGSHAALSCAPKRPRFRWAELMRVFEIDVLACPSCGGRMKPIAEITDRRLAKKMLEHVGLPSESSPPWCARGPPELVGSTWSDDDQRGPDDELGTIIVDAD